MTSSVYKTAICDVRRAYGAPMGRVTWGRPEDCPDRGVHLFHVPLDTGGYDSGGAYWGTGQRLYCAYAHEYYCDFVRASTREDAARKLSLDNRALIRPIG